jgi:hypothetical protein
VGGAIPLLGESTCTRVTPWVPSVWPFPLEADIKKNGLNDNVIKYVKIGDDYFVVNGNNRFIVAQELGITDQLSLQEVSLPFAGFNTESDVINAFSDFLMF